MKLLLHFHFLRGWYARSIVNRRRHNLHAKTQSLAVQLEISRAVSCLCSLSLSFGLVNG